MSAKNNKIDLSEVKASIKSIYDPLGNLVNTHPYDMNKIREARNEVLRKVKQDITNKFQVSDSTFVQYIETQLGTSPSNTNDTVQNMASTTKKVPSETNTVPSETVAPETKKVTPKNKRSMFGMLKLPTWNTQAVSKAVSNADSETNTVAPETKKVTPKDTDPNNKGSMRKFFGMLKFPTWTTKAVSNAVSNADSDADSNADSMVNNHDSMVNNHVQSNNSVNRQDNIFNNILSKTFDVILTNNNRIAQPNRIAQSALIDNSAFANILSNTFMHIGLNKIYTTYPKLKGIMKCITRYKPKSVADYKMINYAKNKVSLEELFDTNPANYIKSVNRLLKLLQFLINKTQRTYYEKKQLLIRCGDRIIDVPYGPLWFIITVVTPSMDQCLKSYTESYISFGTIAYETTLADNSRLAPISYIMHDILHSWTTATISNTVVIYTNAQYSTKVEYPFKLFIQKLYNDINNYQDCFKGPFKFILFLYIHESPSAKIDTDDKIIQQIYNDDWNINTYLKFKNVIQIEQIFPHILDIQEVNDKIRHITSAKSDITSAKNNNILKLIYYKYCFMLFYSVVSNYLNKSKTIREDITDYFTLLYNIKKNAKNANYFEKENAYLEFFQKNINIIINNEYIKTYS